MPTQWYYEAFGEEFGPVRFGELVELVREGVLGEDDLVRPHYESTWQTAETVVGLLHMARRAPVMAAEECGSEGGQGQRDPRPELESLVCGGDEPPMDTRNPELQQPGWLRTLLADRIGLLAWSGLSTRTEGDTAAEQRVTEMLGGDPIPGAAGRDIELESESSTVGCDGEPLGASGNNRAWSAAVEAALESVDARRRATERHGLGRLRRTRWGGAVLGVLGACRSVVSLRQSFRWGVAVVSANVAGWWIQDWSAREALRFPSRDPQTAAQVFPLLGECSGGEYLFCLLDAMLLAGVAGYFAAYWLESQADDS